MPEISTTDRSDNRANAANIKIDASPADPFYARLSLGPALRAIVVRTNRLMKARQQLQNQSPALPKRPAVPAIGIRRNQ